MVVPRKNYKISVSSFNFMCHYILCSYLSVEYCDQVTKGCCLKIFNINQDSRYATPQMMEHCFLKTGHPLSSEDKPNLQFRWYIVLKLGSKVQSDFNMAYRTWRSNTLLYHFKRSHANKQFSIAVRGISKIKLKISNGKKIDIAQYEIY